MARTGKKPGPTVSLFPFLSILACIMGALTLIIYGVALGQAQHNPQAEVYQQAKDRTAMVMQEIERLRQMITRALERERELSEQRDRVAHLQSRLPGSLADMKLAVALHRQYEGLKEQVKAWEDQLAQRGLQIDRLKGQIDARRTEIERIILVRPTDKGLTGVNPTFVECTAAALTVHPSTSTSFDDLVKQTTGQRDRCIVFLIRPDGIARFEKAQVLVRKSNIHYGYLPLPQSGRIDLSLWGITAPEAPDSKESSHANP